MFLCPRIILRNEMIEMASRLPISEISQRFRIQHSTAQTMPFKLQIIGGETYHVCTELTRFFITYLRLDENDDK